MASSQSRVQETFGTAILAKGLDAARDQSDNLLKLLGSVPAPLPEGSGTNIDTYA